MDSRRSIVTNLRIIRLWIGAEVTSVCYLVGRSEWASEYAHAFPRARTHTHTQISSLPRKFPDNTILCGKNTTGRKRCSKVNATISPIGISNFPCSLSPPLKVPFHLLAREKYLSQRITVHLTLFSCSLPVRRGCASSISVVTVLANSTLCGYVTYAVATLDTNRSHTALYSRTLPLSTTHSTYSFLRARYRNTRGCTRYTQLDSGTLLLDRTQA